MIISNIVKILSYLIAVISVFPLFFHINVFYIIIFIVSLLISIKYETEKRLYLNIFGVISIIFTLRNLSGNNLVIPILESIILLFSIKFLEEKKYRDYMQIYTLSLFCAVGYSLLSIKIHFFIYAGAILLLTSIAAVFLTYFDIDENLFLEKKILLKIAHKVSFIFIFSIPLAILIFIILPRVEYPFFDFLNNSNKAATGFSDKISLGDVSEIEEDSSIIFRVKMKKIPENLLYWRGIVLDEFDGKIWRSGNAYNDTPVTFNLTPQYIKQTVYLEPYYGRYLFALDKPVKILNKKMKINKNLTLKYFENIYKRIRYTVYSSVSNYIFQKNLNKKLFLQYPKKISPKILNLAKSLQGKTKTETLENIKDFYLKNQFEYSLSHLPVGKHLLENFLFKNKIGNCEFFASSFALLLRLSNIPARIVAGYKGGEYSQLGKYYIVRQKDAHVWVETYLQKKWVRIDPSAFAMNNAIVSDKSTLKEEEKNGYNLKLILDLINYYYIVFFINYDFNKQVSILKSFSKISINKDYIKFLLFLCFVIVLYLIYKTVKYFFNLNRTDYILKKFLSKLEKKGFKKKHPETLHRLIEKIDDKEIKFKSEKFVVLFEKIYFKDKKFSKKDIQTLKKIIENI